MVSRFAAAIGTADGLTFKEAVARAKDAVTLMADDARRHVANNVATLARLGAGQAHLPEYHKAVAEICSTGGIIGADALSKAAGRYVMLIAETADTDAWSPATTGVFHAALLALHDPDANPGVAADLVAHLDLLSQKLLGRKVCCGDCGS